MNKIFKIIWNKTTQRLEVVSELAKSQGKATASADNRVKVSSTVGFKKSALLTAISLALGLLSAPSFAASFDNTYATGWSMSWGSNNTYGERIGDKTWPIVVGTYNKLFPDNKKAEGYGDPASATVVGRENNITKGMEFSIFGDRNELHAGNVSTVIGMRNSIRNTGTNNNRYLTTVGNKVVVSNPSTEGIYIGNNVTANSSPIAIGNNVYSEIGGSVIGHNAEVRARTASGGGFLTSDSGFAVGSGINGYGNHIFFGRGINLSSGNIASTATADNKKSVYVGQDITAKGSKESVLMGSNITSADDVGHYAVALGSDITLGNGNDQTANSTAVGQHINVTAKNVVAVGSDITASAEKATAIGSGAKATNSSDVA